MRCVIKRLLQRLAILIFIHNTAIAGHLEDTFTNIYKHGVWGRNSQNQGTSGEGSRLDTTEEYRAFLQEFLKAFHIKTVVDFGCGDWEFSQTINWNGIDYIGYDIVKTVIDRNIQKYATDHIKFYHANALNVKLPEADLLICKDVLQHLSNQKIKRFCDQMNKFKYCLITNDVNSETLTSDNHNIGDGGYRRLDITQPPFNIIGFIVMHYDTLTATKQVLLVVKE